jgi:hypothetical protein
MRCWALVLVLVGCHAPTLPPDFPGGVEERLVLHSSQSVLLPVRVNGKLKHFIVDSGASISALTPATARDLGIAATGVVTVNDAVEPTGIVESLAIAEAEHRDVRVAIVDLPAARRMDVDYDGILGLDVLGQHDVVIDFARGKIVLHPAGYVARSAGARELSRVSFRPSRHGLVLVTAEFDFTPIPAVVDLGAQFTMINRAACWMRGVGSPLGMMTKPSQVGMGDVDLGERRMLVADLPIFSRSGLMPGPAIVLGADVFVNRTVVLAYQERSIYVSR